MHVGILTGGGDCPGLNAVIRALTLSLIHECGARVTGIRHGFLGLIEKSDLSLDEESVAGILAEGGTILGTNNRCDPFHYSAEGGADVSARAMQRARELGLDALVVIGGDGTMTIAHRMEQLGLPMVGVPKTIDNDIMSCDRSFGFDSAVAVVADGLNRLLTTARSHGRVMLLETMGRNAGWIALEGGLAGGADVILLPEVPYHIEAVASVCREREKAGKWTLICVAEGAHQVDGDVTVARIVANSPETRRLGGVANVLAHALEPMVQSEVRSISLGHLQRGGAPTPFDRVLSTRLGYAAAQQVRQREWGHIMAVQGDRIVPVPLAEVAGDCRRVAPEHELLKVARGIGVSLGG